MGFIWIFEIIAGIVDDAVHESTWYFTDTLNMLQGFYVFLIFVCKRNVFRAVLDVEPNEDKNMVNTLKRRLLPSVMVEKQTEMVSLNTMSVTNSNTPSKSPRMTHAQPRSANANSVAFE